MINHVDETTKTVVFVLIVPRAILNGKSGIADAGPYDGHKYSWNSDAPECQHEDLDPACFCGIVTVVIRCNRAPAGGRGEADGHEGEEGAGKRQASVEAGDTRVNVRCGLAYQDTHQDEGSNPGVFFKGMDHGETKDGNEVGDDGNDNTADADGHGVIRDGAEDLTTNDDVDDGKTTSDKDVEHRAQLRSPEAKGIPGCSNGTETKLSGALAEHDKKEDRKRLTFGPKVPQ